MDAMSCTVPISLLTHIILTSIVSGLIRRLSSSLSICPLLSVPIMLISKPKDSRNSRGLYTAACSIAVLIICLP